MLNDQGRFFDLVGYFDDLHFDVRSGGFDDDVGRPGIAVLGLAGRTGVDKMLAVDNPVKRDVGMAADGDKSPPFIIFVEFLIDFIPPILKASGAESKSMEGFYEKVPVNHPG